MLRIHQRLGIITLAPLAGACITSAFAPPDLRKGKKQRDRPRHPRRPRRRLRRHVWLHRLLRHPRAQSLRCTARGGIKLHKYLIYIHAPGMILTPILGAMAYDQANNGEKVHGIASAHAAVAWTTVAAYGAAIVAVSWPIHLGSLKLLRLPMRRTLLSRSPSPRTSCTRADYPGRPIPSGSVSGPWTNRPSPITCRIPSMKLMASVTPRAAKASAMPGNATFSSPLP